MTEGGRKRGAGGARHGRSLEIRWMCRGWL
jgi:hypothetical protein